MATKKRSQRKSASRVTKLAGPLAAVEPVSPIVTRPLGLVEKWNTLPPRTKLLIGGGAVAIILTAIFRKKIAAGVVEVGQKAGQAAAQVISIGSTEAFKLALPAAGKQYADDILRVAREESLSPYLLAGFMEQESGFGQGLTPKGPTGKGDAGYGHGLMQIDSRSHAEFLAKKNSGGVPLWQIPYENLKYAAKVYKDYRRFLSMDGKGKTVIVKPKSYAASQGVPPGTYKDPRPLQGDALIAATIAAYNTGPGNVLFAVAAGKPPDQTTTGRKLKTGEVLKYTNSVLARMSALADKTKSLVS